MATENVSIIIPTYNRAHFIAGAIRSILPSVTPGDEVIVIDDGSKDDTARVVEADDAPWRGLVRYLRVENGGAGRARNIGLAEARHELVAFVDSDDEWLPGGLAVRRALMQARPDVAFCMTDFGTLKRDGTVAPGGIASWTQDLRPWDEILAPGVPFSALCPLPHGQADFRVHIGSLYRPMFALTVMSSYVCINTAVVRRSAATKAIQFPEDDSPFEDWGYFSRLAQAGPCAYLDVLTAVQRAHDGPRLTALPALTAMQARLRIIERLWAQDADFMREHGGEVRASVNACRRRIVRELIKLNRRQEARNWLERMDSAWLEHAFMWIPHPVLRMLGRAA
jgi:glycosyltransferase involved in cell wall biosynthesis